MSEDTIKAAWGFADALSLGCRNNGWTKRQVMELVGIAYESQTRDLDDVLSDRLKSKDSQ